MVSKRCSLILVNRAGSCVNLDYGLSRFIAERKKFDSKRHVSSSDLSLWRSCTVVAVHAEGPVSIPPPNGINLVNFVYNFLMGSVTETERNGNLFLHNY